jgi:hypothetical protein
MNMKKFFLFCSMAVVVFSCAKKVAPSKSEIPSSNSGTVISNNASGSNTPSSYSNSNSSSTTTANGTGAVAGSNSPVAGSKIVAKAGTGDESARAGQATYNAKCGSCHGLKVVSDFTAARWASIMAVENTRANLSQTERTNVLAYVTANAKK